MRNVADMVKLSLYFDKYNTFRTMSDKIKIPDYYYMYKNL